MEFVNPEGLRQDGRRPKELRQLSCQLGVLAKADGSAMFEMGNTKVSMVGNANAHFWNNQQLPVEGHQWGCPIRRQISPLLIAGLTQESF